MIFLDGGKIVEQGTPAEVLDHPSTQRAVNSWTRSFPDPLQ